MHTHADIAEQKNFKKPPTGWHAPGLKWSENVRDSNVDDHVRWKFSLEQQYSIYSVLPLPSYAKPVH